MDASASPRILIRILQYSTRENKLAWNYFVKRNRLGEWVNGCGNEIGEGREFDDVVDGFLGYRVFLAGTQKSPGAHLLASYKSSLAPLRERKKEQKRRGGRMLHRWTFDKNIFFYLFIHRQFVMGHFNVIGMFSKKENIILILQDLC